MSCYLLAVGNELLCGATVNSNAACISRHLQEKGWQPAEHCVIADDVDKICAAFKTLSQEEDVVIVTGGLGPTCDDHTREAVALFLERGLIFSQELADKLAARYGSGLKSLQDQATIPAGVELLENSIGTASGLAFTKNGTRFFCLPGVPEEMEVMLVSQVLPKLGEAKKLYSLRHSYVGLVESDIDPLLREVKKQAPRIAIGIYPLRGVVVVHMTSLEEAALTMAAKELDEAFGSRCFSRKGLMPEEALHELLITHKKTLALAESCTGGAIAARLTALSGASEYFLGSFVTYSNRMKVSALGVAEDDLKNFGAVSEPVALAMWRGACARTGSDYAIAVTGIAGPGGGSDEKPVGTVFAAYGNKDAAPKILRFTARGTRRMVIDYCVNRLLAELCLAL